MSTDLLERKESREVLSEIRAIQKLTIELHSLYTMIESKHHEIESELQNKVLSLQDKVYNSQSQNTQLERELLNVEKSKFDLIREKNEILKGFDDWDKYERKVSHGKFVYFEHKAEAHVYACAVCKGKEPYPVILQLISPTNNYHKCSKCGTFGEIL